MARAIWTGSITFGLVSIPVGLFSATEDRTIHFHQFERGTSDRIRYRRVNERTEKEVDYADIVKGADVGDGEYVILEPEELEAVAPGRSRSLEILTFVDLDEVDPLYFQKTYWVAPTEEQYARPYGLLLQAMERTNRAAIGAFVMRSKEYLAAIRPDRGGLALETLFFADEVRDPAELELPEPRSARRKELDMAIGLIEAMSGPWRPEDYRDTYRERVEQLIEDKHRGREIVTQAEAPEPTAMSDLIKALEHSVAAARRGGTAREREDAGADLAEASKAELTEMARDLGIAGRSKMKRAELEKAVAKASRSAATHRAAS